MTPLRWLAVVLCAAFGVTGCHGMKSPEYATLAAMAGGVGIAAQKVPPICEGMENSAVDSAATRDAAVAATGAIQARCTMAITVLAGVGNGLKSARDAVHDAPAGQDLTAIMPWLKLAAKQYCDVIPLLAPFKIDLPTFPGVC